MEAANPQLGAMLRANPQLRTMMQNPAFLQQAMGMASSMFGCVARVCGCCQVWVRVGACVCLWRCRLRICDVAAAVLARRCGHHLLTTASLHCLPACLVRSGAAPGGAPGATGTGSGTTPPATATPPAAAPFDFAAMARMMGGGGMGFPTAPAAAAAGSTASAPAPAPAAPAVAPEVRFASQLEQLHAMGFTDDAANIRALTVTQGNVNFAVERLLGGM